MQNLQENFLKICDMEIHMDKHENGKNYKCNSCGKLFTLNGDQASMRRIIRRRI